MLIGLLLCLLAACSGSDPGSSEGDTGDARRALRRPGVDLAIGGKSLTLSGVEIEVLAHSGTGQAFFTGVATGGAGASVPGGTVVSAEHQLAAHGVLADALTVPLMISLPIDTSLLSAKADPLAFAAQYLDAASGTWRTANAMPTYDAATRRVSFQTGHLSTWRVVKLVDLSDELDQFLFITDHFRIKYTVAASFGKVSALFPIDDPTWQAKGGRKGTDAVVPDYIEDLGKVLEETLTFYLSIPSTGGGKLFPPPWWLSTFMDVTVTHVDGGSGDSRLGGPMRISAKLDDLQEMRLTAAHELGHVMQDEHYTMAGAALNRWFIEASANLWSVRAARIDRATQVSYYKKEMDSYLKESLDVSLEGSYYAAADFLGWLEAKTGKQLTADVMAADYTWDLSGLSALTHGPTNNLGKYFTEYALAATVGGHDFKPGHLWTQKGLTAKARGWRLETRQPHLSVQAVEIRTDLAVDALLVATSGRNYLNSAVKSHSYTGTALVADPSKTLESLTPDARSVVVKHFGRAGSAGVVESAFRQVLVNPQESDVVVGGVYTFDYYLLETPPVTVTTGKVSWTFDASDIPNWPYDPTITGFNVYRDGTKLNGSVLGSGQRVYNDVAILANSTIVVTVTDRLGNEWPEVQPPFVVPFVRVRDVCASFTYTSKTVLSGIVEGPFSVIHCVEPPGSLALTWAAQNFSVRSGELFVGGGYTLRGPSGPQVENIVARRPLGGRYAKTPPPFEIQIGVLPQDPKSSLIRFKAGGTAIDGRYTIRFQPEDDCSGGFCEARMLLQIVPGSVTISVTALDY